MKINEQKTCFIEVKFEDLKPGDTFAEKICNPYNEDDYFFTYMMKGEDLFMPLLGDERPVGIRRGCAINLKNGRLRCYNPDRTVIPIDINAEVSWPTKCIRRK